MRGGIQVILILSIILCAVSFADDSLIACWPLDGNTDDTSGNTLHGTCVNGPAWSNDGFLNQCLSLDGMDDYVEIPNFKGITGTGSRTCLAWIKTSTVDKEILSWGSFNPSSMWRMFLNSSGHLQISVLGGYIEGKTVLSDNQWHYIAVTLANDGSMNIANAKLYVDGSPESTTSSYGPVNTGNTQNVQVGYNQMLGTGRFFKGLVDEIRIYNRALNESEILTVFYSFDGGKGTVDEPFQISTPQQLMNINSLKGLLKKHYILNNDIVFDPDNNPSHIFNRALIAPDTDTSSSDFGGTPFTGVFNGNGHTIHNLRIDTSGVESFYLGLFGQIKGANAAIKYLGITDLKITSLPGTAMSSFYIGGLCGGITDSASINNCYTTGSIISGDRSNYLGGLCGYNDSGFITNCYSTCTVTSGSRSDCIGGLCGANYDGIISKCYSAGAIRGQNFCWFWGGFCGVNTGTVTDSYCYLFSAPDNNISAALDESQMLTMAGFAGFDFSGNSDDGYEDAWSLITGHCPSLAWQTDNGPLLTLNMPVTTLSGTGHVNDPFLIQSKEDFTEFVTNTDLNRGYYALLTDIDLAGKTFTGSVKDRLFGAHFAGNHHTIRNVTINTNGAPTALDFLGLFSRITGTMEDLTIENMHLTNVIYVDTIGGLCGNINGSLKNCHIKDSIVTSSKNYCIGGLCGSFGGGTIANCSSINTVVSGGNNSSATGGLCGGCSGIIKNNYSICTVSGFDRVGGLTGDIYYGKMSHCYSIGTVTGSGASVGGLCGWNFFGNITDCYSTGTVNGQGNYVGGLCGYNDYSQIENCYSTSSVTGKKNYIGGLCGQCSNSNISRSYSTGTVQGEIDSVNVGGLCGYKPSANITGSF